MSQESVKWMLRFMELAETVATWSRDPSTQVGAIIVDEQKTVCGLGYNGFPRGVRDLADRYEERTLKYAMIVHSEANAILNAQGRNIRGATIYATKFPCTECVKLIIQAGIALVVSPKPDPARNASDARWAANAEISKVMLAEAGVELRYLVDGAIAYA